MPITVVVLAAQTLAAAAPINSVLPTFMEVSSQFPDNGFPRTTMRRSGASGKDSGAKSVPDWPFGARFALE